MGALGILPVDNFDALLVLRATILRKQSDIADDAGVPGQKFTAIATDVPCRLSKGYGRPKEMKADEKYSFDYREIFMRPYTGPGAPLTRHDWLRVTSSTGLGVGLFDIMNIVDPSGVGHHYEIWVQEINP